MRCLLQIEFIVLIIFFLFSSLNRCASSKDIENNTFVPTKDWQTIKEGQSIPAGLHVRINLSTGKKEAKLMDENENETGKDNNRGVMISSGDLENSFNELNNEFEETLKKLSHQKANSDEDQQQSRNKFKSYDELKKDFAGLNMNIKTDLEIITDLISEYKNFTTTSSTTMTTTAAALFNRYDSLLEDFSNLVHQIDNSLWFIQQGGLDLILIPMIVNQTNVALRIKSLRTLGALAQNNPKAQISVFEKNFGTFISQILITSNNQDELSASLYAFGSLLRKFPHAQKEILPKSGITALMAVLNKDTSAKIKMKVLILISDLLIEKEHALNFSTDDENDKINQYKNVEFDLWLKQNNFCNILIDFVVKDQNHLLVHIDLIDYLVESLEITQKICFDIWSKSIELKNALQEIEERFNTNVEEQDLDEVKEKLRVLNGLLFTKGKKDEL